MKDLDERVRANLKKFRTEAGMSASELSTEAGLSRKAVWSIENGHSQSPKLSTWYALAGKLNLTVDELIEGHRSVDIDRELRHRIARMPEEQRLLIEGLLQVMDDRSETA